MYVHYDIDEISLVVSSFPIGLLDNVLNLIHKTKQSRNNQLANRAIAFYAQDQNDVPVNNILTVQITQSQSDLGGVKSCSFLRKESVPGKMEIKLAAVHILHHKA